MANITEEHLHHMARKHHATMKKLEAVEGRVSVLSGRVIGNIEHGVASWLGGMVEGRYDGLTVLKVPVNLGIGIVLLAASHLPHQHIEKWSTHLSHLGNGFIGSYVAATGYAFGKRWRETGKLLGGHEGHPWTHPYDLAGAAADAGPGATTVHGDIDPSQMDAIVQRMRQAAHASAHP